MTAISVSRRNFLLQSGSFVALSAALNGCVPMVAQTVGNDIRWLSTNITVIVTEIKKIFPNALNPKISAIITDLISIANDLYNIANTIWPTTSPGPSTPAPSQMTEIGQDVYSFIDALDKLADIASQLTSNPIASGITIALGAILLILKALGISPPAPTPGAAPTPAAMQMLSLSIPSQGHFFRASAEEYARTHTVEQARLALQAPVQ
jgi:hypothetical protein